MNGYILLPVVLLLAFTAAISYVLNREGGGEVRSAGNQRHIDASRYAAEAGLQHEAWLAQTKNCANYTNLASTPLALAADGASYSATVSPTSGSPVLITATGTLTDGTSHTLARGAEVYQPTVRQMILPAVADTYIDNSASNSAKNYGASDKLRVNQNSANALLKFDLSRSPISPYAQIASAQLELQRYGTGPGAAAAEVSAHKVINVWAEGAGGNTGSTSLSGATWALGQPARSWTNAGGDTDTRKSAKTTVTVGPGSVPFVWDITDLTRDWLAQPVNNYGVMLKTTGALLNADFRSDEASQTSERPKLTLNYRLPCGRTNVTLASSADTYINKVDAGSQDNNYGAGISLLQGNQDKHRVLMRFDTSTIPAGTRLNSAILRIYMASDNNNGVFTIYAYPLSQPWIQGTGTGGNSTTSATWKNRTSVTWATPGGDYSATAYQPPYSLTIDTTSFTSGWLDFEMTRLTQSWVDNAASNYGVILVSENTSDTLTLNSNEASSNRPQLVIAY